MNLKFSPKITPAGSRFLYREGFPGATDRGDLKEGTIREWSTSGNYLNWDGKWISIEDTSHITLVEILNFDSLYYNNNKF